jgi:stage IV sporulation protein FB
VLLILIHELGHALLVQRYRLGVSEVAIHAVGGYCRHDAPSTRFQEAMIAWGGVWAQAVVLVVTYALVLALGAPESIYAAQLVHAFIETNLWIICFNLIPLEPLDGAKAWPLVGMLRDRFRGRAARTRGERERHSAVQQQLRDLERMPEPRADDNARKVVEDLIARTTRSKLDR